jgi:CSLREA domain-containing protein
MTFWLRLLAATHLLLATATASAAVGFGATIVVNTPNDEFGTVPGNCSLREAVQTANTNADFGGCTHTGSFATGPNADIVQLPAADPGYALARTGAEDDTNVLGDIDITSNITIQGAGAGTTPIFVCGGCPERVIDVVSGTNVAIKDVTLKLGHPASGGAGLFVDVPAVVTLTHVTIGLNTSSIFGGGIFNRGTLTVNDSAITNNTTQSEGGAGIFNGAGATLTLNDSRVLDNTTSGNDVDGHGAGILNFTNGTLVLNNTTVDGNVIAVNQTVGGSAKGNGGGIYNRGSLAVHQSTISNNVASGKGAEGGGVFCESDATQTLIELSVIFANDVVENSGPGAESNNGGGVSVRCPNALIRDSVISGNQTSIGSGGGVFVGDGGDLRILNSTVAQNFAKLNGGGVAANGVLADASIAVVNSTLINNSADADGGGGAFEGLAVALIKSATIVTNRADANDVGGQVGGGIFSNVVVDPVIRIGLGNSVLAGNLKGGSTANECGGGIVSSFGYNLIQSSAGCSLSNGDADIENFPAKLAAATNNGGPIAGASSGVMAGMLTRAPLADSPLLDAGKPSGCTDEDGVTLVTDQVGGTRSLDGLSPLLPPGCDIGAIELDPAGPVFRNSFE